MAAPLTVVVARVSVQIEVPPDDLGPRLGVVRRRVLGVVSAGLTLGTGICRYDGRTSPERFHDRQPKPLGVGWGKGQ